MSQQAVHVRIVGRGQGVWYRGWVRNRRDGSVEAVFSGNQSAIDQMIEKCRIGPHSARVDQVLVELENNEVQPGFNQLPTD